MFVYTEHKCNMHAHRAQWTEAMSENKMQGWLKKESHDYFRAMRKWQWRYFILDFSTKRLSYYTDESLADQRGEYELDGSVLSEVMNPNCMSRANRVSLVDIDCVKYGRCGITGGRSTDSTRSWFRD